MHYLSSECLIAKRREFCHQLTQRTDSGKLVKAPFTKLALKRAQTLFQKRLLFRHLIHEPIKVAMSQSTWKMN